MVAEKIEGFFMGVFNYYGLAIIIIIMIPNIVWAAKQKGRYTEYYTNKTVGTLEQVGRFGCFITMIVNIPFTYLGFWTSDFLTVYIAANAVLVTIYIVTWIVKGNRESIPCALILAIVPSIIFIFDGIAVRSLLLFALSLIFAPTHILISYKNSSAACKATEKAAEKSAGSVND